MNSRNHLLAGLALAALFAGACARADADSAPPPPPAAVGVVDSILPPEEALRRFTAGLDAPVHALREGASSPAEITRRLLDAVAAGDSVALEGALLSRAEFAYLLYPHHPHAAPPYSLAPQVLWTMTQAQSHQAVLRLRRQVGSDAPDVAEVRCEGVEPFGTSRLHTGCTAALAPSGGSIALGSLLEREGRFKVAALTP